MQISIAPVLYVPFKILFIEGMLQYFDGDGGGYRDAFDVPMTAAGKFIWVEIELGYIQSS